MRVSSRARCRPPCRDLRQDGKQSPESMKIRTPSAIMGVRGMSSGQVDEPAAK
jgi:hypothetical protein